MSPRHKGAEARKEDMPLDTVSGVSLRTRRLVDCGFGLGTCGKVALSPCLNGAEGIKEGVLLSSIGGYESNEHCLSGLRACWFL